MEKAKTRGEYSGGPRNAFDEVIDGLSGPLFRYLFERDNEDEIEKMEEEL